MKNLYIKSAGLCFCFWLLFSTVCMAQKPPFRFSDVQSATPAGSKAASFIENAGQYGKVLAGYEYMGPVKFGFEGFDMPVLFTKSGLIHLQRRVNPISKEQEEKFEKEGLPEEEIERKKTITDRTITMQWVDANPDVEIVAGEKRKDYHTYWMQTEKAWAYKSITYKNIYPGIDIVYSFPKVSATGFEYSIIVHPGADPSLIKMKYGGDVKKLKIEEGKLVIRSEVNGVTESAPVCYYNDRVTENKTAEIPSGFEVKENVIGFVFPSGYDRTKTFIIDPFVSNTTVLTGLNAGKAKDVDFDYLGNIYVTGGGDGNTTHKLAKYDAGGNLLWTFSGVLSLPAWNFGPYFGGWVVDKSTGNIYMGQGFDFTTGFIVVRLSTTGIYDNYITTGNPNFRENWKMIWNCNAGSPQILVAGGGTNSDINLGIFSPPSTFITASNLTGIVGIAFQDMADMVIDPLTNSMYTLYASGSIPALNNSIYKHNQPYSAATRVWNVGTGYPVLQEAANRPYFGFSGLQENSANILAVNSSYLFYWDGRNLKAMNKATGATVGTPLTDASAVKLMQGGIVADACDNIYVGSTNGTIKVYKFTGAVFDDAAMPDLNIAGYATSSVYDLAYDEQRKMLYACGDGFVASFDISGNCTSTTYTVNIVPNCSNGTVVASLSPAPPVGSAVNYALFIGASQIASNSTGNFTGLSPLINYTIVATINQACSGSQANANFTMPGPDLSVSITNTTCGASTGQIIASGSGGTSPYSFSLDGISYQPSGTFSSLASGVYNIYIQDAGGCITRDTLIIANSNGPVISLTKVDATCGNNTGTITANVIGGTAPYQYSINGTVYQSNNVFVGLTGNIYTVYVKDATGCINTAMIGILSGSTPLLMAIPGSATCSNNNGTINAYGTGGFGALQYSINGNTFQVANQFTNLSPGAYTVTVRDESGCIKTAAVTVANVLPPTITATSTTASCSNANGSITATGSGGVAPLQYSLDGTTFDGGNVFLGMVAGLYTVSVRDVVGCVRTVQVTVASTNGPTVTATSTLATCGVANGTITATGAGGVAPYQYSLDNVTYQAGATFTGLLPGNYIVYTRDNTGCRAGTTVVVGNIASPTVTAVATAASCNALDGTITATGNGGTGGLQYSINGTVFQPGTLFNGLAPQVYTVTVKDGLNCIGTTTVTVPNAAGITLSLSNVSSSCNGNSGTITATGTGGVSPYQYSLDGVSYQASNVFNNVAPGSYTVYFKDANGCVIARTTTVSANLAPLLSLTVTNANCGGSNGVIRANGSGGTAPLQYNIDGGAYQSVSTFTGLTVASHTVTVKDAAGCIVSQTASIVNSGTGVPPTDVTFRVTDVLACTGNAGRIKNIKGVPSGGGNSYDFSLDGGAFTSANQFTNVPPGVHTITAINDDGCTVTRVAVVGAGTPATANIVSVVGTACNTTNGSITISGVGTTTPYHASINGVGGPWITFFPPGANSRTFSGLAPGSYAIMMADDADFTAGSPDIPGACLTTTVVAVPSFGGPAIATAVTPGNCFSVNGSVSVTGSGSTGPYQYNLNGGAFQSGTDFTNLVPGNYVFGVMDFNGCVNYVSATVPNPPTPSITATVTPEACGSGNGTVVLTGTGGTAPLQYSIDGFNFQISSTFNNLAAGVYTFTVKDVNGCYSVRTVSVTAATRPVVNAFGVAASCGQSNGVLVAVGSAGTAPYQFSIDGILYQSSGSFSGMAAGVYTVYIKDNRGCINQTSVSLGNTGAATFSTTITAARCSNANGGITVTASGGQNPLQFSLDGISYQSGSAFTNILPGDYTVYVRDGLGCITTRNILVGNSPAPHTLTSTIVNAACGLNNGSITVAGVGGTAPLQYSVNGTAYQAGTIFNSMAAGAYTLYVKDALGCITTSSASLLNLAGPTVTTTSTAASCGLNDGTIRATVNGGTGVVSYSRNGVLYQASPVFTGLPAGTYTITVRDARFCTSTSIVTIDPFITLSATATTTDAHCGIASGSITVNGTGGTGPYQYSLDGVTYQLSNVFSSLAANSYLVRVKDANNCNGTITVVLSDSPPMGGVYTVGSGGDFNTLTAAVQAYNTNCISGPITFLLTDANYSTNETFPITINSNIYASNVNTLTIKPAIGASPIITGNNGTAILRFNGADYVTIDGSNTVGGITRDLHIENSSTASGNTVIRFNSNGATDGVTNNGIRSCVLSGSSSAGTYGGIVTGGQTVGSEAETPNSDNIFFNNQISKVQSGIVLVGPAGGETGNQVSGNQIGSTIDADKLSRNGILLRNQQSTEITGNEVTGVKTADAFIVSGIAVKENSFDISINRNSISGIRSEDLNSNGANGIQLNTTVADANITAYNNFISDISAHGSIAGRGAAHNGYGILLDGPGGFHIYHNTVVLNSNQDVAGYSAALNLTSLVSTVASIDIRNNIFGNIQTQTGEHYAIESEANVNVFNSIDYNDYYVASGNLGYIGNNRVTLADIQTGFGSDLHSLNLTPVYLAANDFHIDRANVSNGVNLGDRGIAIAGIDIDYDNTTRNGLTPDIGADEWLKPNYASWVGKIDTDWLVPENWETNVVPDGTTDVTITGGYTHMPTIITVQEVRDLRMSAPDAANTPILTLTDGSIQINGLIVHSGGTIDGLHGTVVMNGTQQQNIPAGLFENNSLNNLVVGNNTNEGVVLDGQLDIYRSVKFTATGLHLATNDLLTFKSTDTVTAWLGNMTGKTITGNATVERYIPNHSKAWQLLAVPTNGQTIKDAWQEGSAAPNSNPVPGYGTQITCNIANATVHPSPGYDLFSPNGPSIKIYNAATGLYDGVASTTNLIDNPKGYMLFVRGDRSVTTFGAPATSTVLRTKGTLFTPAHPPALVNVNSGTAPLTFESIGNPYPSAIDLSQLTLNESGGGVQDIFYVWDPRLTTGPNSAYGLGGFQVLTRNGNDYDVTPGGGSYGATNKYIQSGQAFFVNAPFTSGTVRFTENCKVDGSNMVHRGTVATGRQLRTNLSVIRNGEKLLIDGNLLQYDASFSNSFDIEDALKISNTGENFAIRSNNQLMMVERRSPITENDTIFYHTAQMRAQQYQFDFIASDLSRPGLQAFLEDNHLHTSVPVSLTDSTHILFTVDTSAGSYASNRFRIVFKQLTTTPVFITNIKASWNQDNTAAVSWSVENETAIQHYTIERSDNGRQFFPLMNQVPMNNNNGSWEYKRTDSLPLEGYNYYRIKAISTDGRVQYSNIAKLTPVKTNPGIVMYPNPVTDRKLHIRFTDQRTGDYYVYLVNQLGQSVYNRTINISNRNQVVVLPIEPIVADGVYKVVVVSARANKHIQQIIIQ